MSMTAGHTIIHVDTDPQGYLLARSIPVHVSYIKEVDASYGEDADGQRGTILIEYDVLEIWLEPEDLKTISLDQAVYAAVEAEAIFRRRGPERP